MLLDKICLNKWYYTPFSRQEIRIKDIVHVLNDCNLDKLFYTFYIDLCSLKI